MKRANRWYPPEWYPQQTVELAWPDSHTDWKDILSEVQACYREIIAEIARHAEVLLLCNDAVGLQVIFDEDTAKQIHLAEIPYNDTWARDFGSITVFENNKPLMLDFAFNGWGMKFAADYDNCTNRALKQSGFFGRTGLENCKNTVLEGGSIESDGEGALMTTSACLLSPNRNDEWGRAELEQMFKERLGVQKVLWLEHGLLAGDDTDGHIDTLARFAPGNRIVYCKCNDASDSHYEELEKMEQDLDAFTNCIGEYYELHPVPLPSPVFYEGERLPATYVNYLICNDAVLVPLYGVPEDNEALNAVEKAHPGYTVKGINCLPLVKQHGSLHCITMNYPKIVKE